MAPVLVGVATLVGEAPRGRPQGGAGPHARRLRPARLPPGPPSLPVRKRRRRGPFKCPPVGFPFTLSRRERPPCFVGVIVAISIGSTSDLHRIFTCHSTSHSGRGILDDALDAMVLAPANRSQHRRLAPAPLPGPTMPLTSPSLVVSDSDGSRWSARSTPKESAIGNLVVTGDFVVKEFVSAAKSDSSITAL